MKIINKMALKNCFLGKVVYIMLILFIVIFYFFHNVKFNNCYSLYHLMFSKNIVLYIIIPLWIWLLSNIDEFYYNYLTLLKFSDIKRWLYEKTKIMALVTAIYILILDTIMLSIIAYHGIEIHLDFILYLFTGFLLQCIVFLTLGIFATLLFLKWKSIYSSYGFTYCLLFFLKVVGAILNLEWIDFQKTMFLNSRDYISVEQAIQLIWICVICNILYRLTASIGERNEIYWNIK